MEEKVNFGGTLPIFGGTLHTLYQNLVTFYRFSGKYKN